MIKLIQRMFFYAIVLSTACYAMDTQEEPSSKRHKSSATDDIVTALFEQFNQNPFDKSSIVQLITQLKSQTCIDPFCFARQLDGDTLLLKAVRARSYEIAAALLSIPECKTIINTSNSFDTCTPLAIAIENFDNSIVQLLIEHKVNTNAPFCRENNITTSPLNYAMNLGNVNALRLLLGAETRHGSFGGIEIHKTQNQIGEVKPLAKKMLLHGISVRHFSTFSRNPASFNSYIDVPFSSAYNPLQNLMFAIAQGKIIILKKLLAQSDYKNILLKNDDDGRSLFSLANHLAFDTTRVRTELEKNEHLPIWQQQALMIGKPVSKWALMTFKKHQKLLPKDMVLLVLSFVIGESLLTHMRQQKPIIPFAP